MEHLEDILCLFISMYQPQHCVALVQAWVEIEGISALQGGSKNPLPWILNILKKLVASLPQRDLGCGMALGTGAVCLSRCQR